MTLLFEENTNFEGELVLTPDRRGAHNFFGCREYILIIISKNYIQKGIQPKTIVSPRR